MNDLELKKALDTLYGYATKNGDCEAYEVVKDAIADLKASAGSQRDKYKAFKNYMHNELGIGRGDIRNWTMEATHQYVEQYFKKDRILVDSAVKFAARNAIDEHMNRANFSLGKELSKRIQMTLKDERSVPPVYDGCAVTSSDMEEWRKEGLEAMAEYVEEHGNENLDFFFTRSSGKLFVAVRHRKDNEIIYWECDILNSGLIGVSEVLEGKND